MCEAVLAKGELMALIGHYLGKCDAEVMGAFDRVAKAKGQDRDAHIARLRELVAERERAGGVDIDYEGPDPVADTPARM